MTPLAIRNLNPRRGPVDGGTEVAVEGAGFGEGLRAWLGGEELEGIIRDGNALTFTTPAGAGGPVELRLERGLERSRLANAFTYEAPLHLNGLHPESWRPVGWHLRGVDGLWLQCRSGHCAVRSGGCS